MAHPSFTETLTLPRGPVDLAAYDPHGKPGFKGSKKKGKAALYAMGDGLADLQERLFAEGKTGGTRNVLLVLQGMDTSGKGGVIVSQKRMDRETVAPRMARSWSIQSVCRPRRSTRRAKTSSNRSAESSDRQHATTA